MDLDIRYIYSKIDVREKSKRLIIFNGGSIYFVVTTYTYHLAACWARTIYIHIHTPDANKSTTLQRRMSLNDLELCSYGHMHACLQISS